MSFTVDHLRSVLHWLWINKLPKVWLSKSRRVTSGPLCFDSAAAFSSSCFRFFSASAASFAAFFAAFFSSFLLPPSAAPPASASGAADAAGAGAGVGAGAGALASAFGFGSGAAFFSVLAAAGAGFDGATGAADNSNPSWCLQVKNQRTVAGYVAFRVSMPVFLNACNKGTAIEMSASVRRWPTRNVRFFKCASNASHCLSMGHSSSKTA
mmetsp:Transcript_28914/g.52873  ORF Transcript_28914/g.52873 Transcript_28914/m.52873 type:complete len:210 (-) Transcript_28914:408-1037(-)